MQLLATTVAAALITSAAGAASIGFVDYGKGPDFRGQVAHGESLGLFVGTLRQDDPRRSAGAAADFGFGFEGGAALPGYEPTGAPGGAALPGGGTAGGAGEPPSQSESAPPPVFAAGPNPPAMSAGLTTETISFPGVAVSSVPLPAGLPLMAAALGGLALMRRVRRD